MVDPQLERVTRHLTRLKLVATRERLDALLQEAARKELGYLDFLDRVLSEEAQAKDQKRTRMGIQIAHFPVVKSLEDFDFSLQPSIDRKLIRELETGRFIANGENVLLLGPPAWERPIWRSGWDGRRSSAGRAAYLSPRSVWWPR